MLALHARVTIATRRFFLLARASRRPPPGQVREAPFTDRSLPNLRAIAPDIVLAKIRRRARGRLSRCESRGSYFFPRVTLVALNWRATIDRKSNAAAKGDLESHCQTF